jgi:hypothetical protein
MIYDQDRREIPPHVAMVSPKMFGYSEEPLKRVITYHVLHCRACGAWAEEHDNYDYLNWIWAK